jgi:tetratricopeptide (TPR) repeat protein
LYSQYILSIPSTLFTYAHDLYLDLAVEQGLPGLLAFLWVLLGGAWLLLKSDAPPALRWASFASTLVLIVHGLVDDPLYASRGTPFLFTLPALGAATYLHPEAPEQRLQERRGATRWQALIAVLAVLLVAVLALISWKPLLASGYANLGAVRMAQVELADFPSGQWQDGSQVPALTGAESLLQRAVGIDSENVTANYRLGLIAMLRRDYPAAQAYLERAFAKEPEHQGVRKSLGYCYAWLGEFELAGKLLGDSPGVRAELEAYTWWWVQQDRPDLAERARHMAEGMP